MQTKVAYKKVMGCKKSQSTVGMEDFTFFGSHFTYTDTEDIFLTSDPARLRRG
jgi:extradiol dioxygenase family protein